MQIKFMDENLKMFPNKSVSSSIIDYYYLKINSQQVESIIGCYDMFKIYETIQPSTTSSTEFIDLCKDKIKQMKNNLILEKYNNYLSNSGLSDIIDILHRCEFHLSTDTMILSIDSVKNDIDRLLLEHLTELPSSSCESFDGETKLIDQETISPSPMTTKNSMKYTICAYLSLLLYSGNEHALMHCLLTSTSIRIPIERLKKNNLTIYKILLAYLRRKELILNGISSLQQDLISINDEEFDVLDKYYSEIKGFINFMEELHMIIEEHEGLKSEGILRNLLELISKKFDEDLLVKEITEEFCQDFQSIFSVIDFTPSIQDPRFLRSIAYFCAKQTVDLPASMDEITKEPVEEKTVNLSTDSVFIGQTKAKENQCQQRPIDRCLDLSTIHEASFESDSIIDHPIVSDYKSVVKRQPLREIDVNSFNNEERQIEDEKICHQNPSGFTLVSDGDKENLPVVRKKRSINSTNIEPPCKKQKKINFKSFEFEQKSINSNFQSTN